MSYFRSHLKSRGLSLKAFAAEVGIAPNYLSELASGLKQPSLRLARDINVASKDAIPVTYWLPEERKRIDGEFEASQRAMHETTCTKDKIDAEG